MSKTTVKTPTLSTPKDMKIPFEHSVELITPEIASEMLENNGFNRTLSLKVAEQYADAMLNNEWMENGETVKFSEDGELLDGQHRLQAVILSKLPQYFLVVRGLNRELMKTIDIGRKRTGADILELHGFKNKHVLAATANISMSFDQEGAFKNLRSGTPTRILNYVQKHKKVSDSVNSYVTQHKKVRPMTAVSMVCAMHHKFSGVNKNLADSFIYAFINGDQMQLHKNDPIRVLREALLRERQDAYLERGKAWKRRAISYFVQAFDSYYHSQPLLGLAYDPEAPIVINRKKYKS